MEVPSLGREDPLEEDMATHTSIPAWGIPMNRGAWGATVHGVTKSQTRLSDFTSGETGHLKIHPESHIVMLPFDHRLVIIQYSWASLLAQMVKNLPAMRETWV